MSSGTRDSVGHLLWRIAGRLHLRRSTVEEWLLRDRKLRRDVGVLGRGIGVGMFLAAERLGLSLADGCPRDRQVFLRLGDYWLVAYNGAPKYARHSLGMSYISLLLQKPGDEVSASELLDLVSGDGTRACLGSAGPMIDEPSIVDYQNRLAQNEAEMIEAKASADLARQGHLSDEREWLLSELRRANVPGGKVREALDQRERDRKAVSMAVGRAIEAIRKIHKPLWHHLWTYIDTGNFLCYRSDPSNHWTT